MIESGISQIRDVAPFSSVAVEGYASISVATGPFAVEIVAAPWQQEQVELEVDEFETLRITCQSTADTPVRLKISTPAPVCVESTPPPSSSNEYTTDRPIIPFDRLNVTGDVHVMVKNGPHEVKVVGDDVSQNLVGVQTVGRELRISCPPANRKPVVYVHAPTLASVRHDGGGEVRLISIESDDLVLRVLGDGGICAVTGGTAGRLTAEVFGDGCISVSQIKAIEGVARISGGGKINASIAECALVESAGGEVLIEGSPAKRTCHMNGFGEVRFL